MPTVVNENRAATLCITSGMNHEALTIGNSIIEALELGIKRLNIQSSSGLRSATDMITYAATDTQKVVTYFSLDRCTSKNLMWTVEHYRKLEGNILLIENYEKATLNGQYSVEEAQEIIELFIKAFDAELTIISFESE